MSLTDVLIITALKMALDALVAVEAYVHGSWTPVDDDEDSAARSTWWRCAGPRW